MNDSAGKEGGGIEEGFGFEDGYDFGAALGFFPCDPRGEGTTRQIGNIHSRKLASRPVFLYIPKGGNADCMSLLNEMATMPSSVLFLLSQQRITPAIHALVHDCGIMLESVIER